MRRLATVLAGAVLAVAAGALVSPATGSAASDAKTSLFPIGDGSQLATHVQLDCVISSGGCTFTVGADLRNGDEVSGFPADLWARQSTEIRPAKRTTYLDVHTDGGEGPWADRGGPGTKVFKEGGMATITSIYAGEGPPDKYQTSGTITATDNATGQPNWGAKVVVCTHIQVVYAGVNITGPSTCAQTTFS